MATKEPILINGFKHILFEQIEVSNKEMLLKSEDFYQKMDKRRSVREFSSKPVSKNIIENLIKTASTAPSGAHKQPWTFCAISNPKIKK